MSLEFAREHLCLGRPSIHTPSHGTCLPLNGTEVYHARFLGLRQANTRCSEQPWLSWTAAILSNQKPDALMQDRAFDRTPARATGRNLKYLFTPASSAATAFPRPASAAACPPPTPRDYRPPAGPSCRGSRPTPSRDGETARHGPSR